MKKTILLLIFLYQLSANAQPRIIGTAHFHGPKFGGSLFRINLPGSGPGSIYSFDNSTPHNPLGNVIAGNDDWLYGSVAINGNNGNGALYKIRRNGNNFTKLFNYSSSDYSVPYYHTDEMIYVMGGNELKQFDPVNNIVTTLTSNIYSENLHIDTDDWIYYQNNIALHKIQTNGSNQSTLHVFVQPNEGYDPVGITEISSGRLFGIQRNGGVNNAGLIFAIDKDGNNFSIIHDFTTATGIIPISKLVYIDGKLYGTTANGGDNGFGTIYTINEDGTGFRAVYHFTGGGGFCYPSGNIAISSNGRIFGNFSVPYWDGSNYNQVYKIDTSGENFQTIFSLSQRESGQTGQGVLLLNNEDLYFADKDYGLHEGGALNYSDTSGSGFNLHQFGYSATGFRPSGGVIKGSDNKLYGTTVYGGLEGNGIVYSVNIDGTGYTKLHEFTNAQGYEPSGKLLEASDGKLYGACRFGTTNSGILYRLDKNGANFQVIYQFGLTSDGYSPVGSLIEDAGGTLYGTTFYSNLQGGSIFKINKNGTGFQELRIFSTLPGELAFLYNGVVLSKGYLYGAAGYGGSDNKGGIYRIRTNGTGYQVLHDFNSATGGELPVGAPIIASNGKLYGTTSNGGTNNEGTVFSIDTVGTNFQILRNLLSSTDGSYPWGGLIQASDGLIYGSTQISNIVPGNSSGGSIFRMNLDGSGFSLVRELNADTDGQGVASSLIDLNGSFSLPVQWVQFNAHKKERTAVLQWQTSAEYNNDRFEIERSPNGSSFTNIGTIASGNSAAGNTYSFTDASPVNGINYYRIKQVDLNGEFEYSRVAQLNFETKSPIGIYPNPVKEFLFINKPGNVSILSATISDLTGRRVRQVQHLRLSSIAVNDLKPGSYFLQLETSEGSIRLRFIKQ